MFYKGAVRMDISHIGKLGRKQHNRTNEGKKKGGKAREADICQKGSERTRVPVSKPR
jgi:hypothetical protein